MSSISATNPDNTDLMRVNVVYPLADEQLVILVELNKGSTVEDAIRLSKIVEKYPEIDFEINKTGIFGKSAKLDAALYPGDRVEIYRPLICDPKEMRKQRAKGNVKG